MRAVPFALSLAIALSGVLLGGQVHAQQGEPSPTGKGITGGALLGAEVVLGVEAFLEVEPTWAYLVGGAAGGALGGVGGYFVEQSGDAHPSILLLAGGMALLIPTTVVVLNATSYRPPRDYVEDSPPSDEPLADPPRAAPPPGPAPRSSTSPARPARLQPPSLFSVAPERLTLGLPGVAVRQAFSQREAAIFGTRRVTEVEISMLSVVF